MEKYAVRQKRTVSSRLLILLLALPLGAASMKDAHFIADSGTFFTGADCGFTLSLPGVEPSKIQTDLPEVPDGVQFVSSKRDEYIDASGQRGTVIRLWFVFSSSGSVQLPPLPLQVGFRSYKIPFDQVTVYENPATIEPVLIVRFENAHLVSHPAGHAVPVVMVPAGQKIRYTVLLKYAVQVVSFSWQLPKNGLFSEIARYDITRGEPGGNSFSPDEIPVAGFEWQPLVAGQYTLPAVLLTVTAYNGSRREPQMPRYEVVVSPPVQSQRSARTVSPASSGLPAAFASAFAPESAPAATDGTGAVQASGQDDARAVCRRIADLRSAERHSFPWGKAVVSRRSAEQSAGITGAPGEPSVPLAVVFSVMCALFAVSAAVFFIVKWRYRGFAAASVAAVCLFLGVRAMVRTVPAYGIFCGGVIRAIPEEKVSTSQSAASGIRVRVVEKAAGWVYIDCTDSGGWVPEQTVFDIR